MNFSETFLATKYFLVWIAQQDQEEEEEEGGWRMRRWRWMRRG